VIAVSQFEHAAGGKYRTKWFTSKCFEFCTGELIMAGIWC